MLGDWWVVVVVLAEGQEEDSTARELSSLGQVVLVHMQKPALFPGSDGMDCRDPLSFP